MAADAAARIDQGPEIWDVGLVHRGGHGDDHEVGALQIGGIEAVFGMDGQRHVGVRDFTGRILACAALLDLLAGDIEADRLEVFDELDDEGEADVAQGNCTTVSVRNGCLLSH